MSYQPGRRRRRRRGSKPYLEVHKAADRPMTGWRILPSIPPEVEHFRSHADLGKRMPASVEYIRWMSCSMFISHKKAAEMAHRFGLGSHFAKMVLDREATITYARRSDGHLDVWAPAETIHACLDDWG